MALDWEAVRFTSVDAGNIVTIAGFATCIEAAAVWDDAAVIRGSC